MSSYSLVYLAFIKKHLSYWAEPIQPKTFYKLTALYIKCGQFF
ncbi:hypothetical protein AC062_1420 [Pasteurellaceae bacterium NI1060]|nr:hypothetical protein AC062_1420 [Pasteurellaceae bacterium NI1060]